MSGWELTNFVALRLGVIAVSRRRVLPLPLLLLLHCKTIKNQKNQIKIQTDLDRSTFSSETGFYVLTAGNYDVYLPLPLPLPLPPPLLKGRIVYPARGHFYHKARGFLQACVDKSPKPKMKVR